MKKIDLSSTLDPAVKHVLGTVRKRLEETEKMQYYTDFERDIDDLLYDIDKNLANQRALIALLQSAKIYNLLTNYGNILRDIESVKKILEIFIPTGGLNVSSQEKIKERN